MKKLFWIPVLLLSWSLTAQNGHKAPQKQARVQAEEDEGPLVFRFEPDLLTQQADRRTELLRKKAIIDTLDISEAKRLKLLKALYRGKDSRMLQKYLLADTRFEEVIVED